MILTADHIRLAVFTHEEAIEQIVEAIRQVDPNMVIPEKGKNHPHLDTYSGLVVYPLSRGDGSPSTPGKIHILIQGPEGEDIMPTLERVRDQIDANGIPEDLVEITYFGSESSGSLWIDGQYLLADRNAALYPDPEDLYNEWPDEPSFAINAFHEGKDAKDAGKSADTNPYDNTTRAWYDWRRGFRGESIDKNLPEMGMTGSRQAQGIPPLYLEDNFPNTYVGEATIYGQAGYEILYEPQHEGDLPPEELGEYVDDPPGWEQVEDEIGDTPLGYLWRGTARLEGNTPIPNE